MLGHSDEWQALLETGADQALPDHPKLGDSVGEQTNTGAGEGSLS